MKKTSNIFKWLLVTIVAIIVVFICWFLLTAIDRPPKVNDLSAPGIERQKSGENTYFVGNNWLRRSESGLWEMYIEGDPFERGVAFGKLTSELLYYQESVFVEQIKKLVPSPRYLKFLKYFTAWFDRNLDKNIPEEYKLEIYGTSFACSPEFDFIGSGYQRQLNYHAAHDIGHALKGLNMVGCTSFSCWNDKTSDSSLIVARNFDFYMGPEFAKNKIVCFYNPSAGYKFMMVSWADMIGVVSGMNEKGLTVTINAAKSSIPLQASTPVTLLAREILQYAETIEQAYNIAVNRKLFVSESIMIGSANDRKTAIIEKSPEKTDLVFPDTTRIICANHFQGDAFMNDKANIENILGSDSKYRYNRVDELLGINERIDVPGAISILRDRHGSGNTDPGMGNPLAVNQLIAHHAIVFKPASQLVWVSASPYQLGRFMAYDLKKVFSLTREEISSNQEIYTSELTIPADSFLLSEDYTGYSNFLRMSEELNKYTAGLMVLPVGFEEKYIKTNPFLFSVYSNLSEYFRKMNDYERAYNYCQKALSMQIPGEDEKNKLKKLSQNLLKRTKHGDTGY